LRICFTIKNIAGNAEEDCTQPNLKKKEYALSAIENLLQKVKGKSVEIVLKKIHIILFSLPFLSLPWSVLI
jgi:hypothetical protein